jgi:hypothetical protein
MPIHPVLAALPMGGAADLVGLGGHHRLANEAII